MQVDIRTAPKFDASVPQKLFDGSSWYSEFVIRQYDVSRDAQKFLVIKNKATGEHTSGPPNITVVLNWQNELKRVAPEN